MRVAGFFCLFLFWGVGFGVSGEVGGGVRGWRVERG